MNSTVVLFAVLVGLGILAAASGHARSPQLVVTETGQGTIDHVVTVESPQHFRLGLAAGMNYGISQWYDLVNDPAGSLNIAHRPNDSEADQASLFNQVLNPGDLIGHILIAKYLFKDAPRACRILESNAARVRIETEYHPMFGHGINPKLHFRTTYTIYASGRIGIMHSLTADETQVIELWRNSVISLGDPTYFLASLRKGVGTMPDETTLLDSTQHWQPGQWAGRQVNFPGWITYEIMDNTSTELKLGRKLSGARSAAAGPYEINSQPGKFGWLRCTDQQSPYVWQKTASEFLRMYWDPATPEPNRNWTKASIMLAPRPDNPRQGGQGIHGWDRFKRFYYECGKFEIPAGSPITQYYMLQLGTANDALLPDLSHPDAARALADNYRTPSTLKFTAGQAADPAYDFGRACHRLAAADGRVAFTVEKGCLRPAFEIEGLGGASLPEVSVDGKPVEAVCGRLSDRSMIVQLLTDPRPGASIAITATPGGKKP